MNNLAISMKKFFTNKNTVTIIGVIAILAILYFLYTSTVNSATKLIEVPVAAKTINPQTIITAEDIKYISVASAARPDNVVMQESAIIDKYTGVGVTIPEGSMFYPELLVEKEDLPGDWLTLVGTDALGNPEIPYQFPVTVTTTYGNSIQPGDYVDFYVRAYNEKNVLMFGKMIENVKVLSVTDGDGKDVFRSTNDIGTPSFLGFGLQAELFDVLKKAEYISGTQIELMVIPHGGLAPEEPLEVYVSSEYLRDFIQNQTLELPKNPEPVTPTPEEGTEGTTEGTEVTPTDSAASTTPETTPAS